jgi:glucuronokinase
VRRASGEAHARAALLGNPSDVYGGRTIAFTFRDFGAEVVVEEARDGRVEPPEADRLLTATLGGFRNHLEGPGRRLVAGGISMRCRTTIPREVGLGGSSAIVIAALRALCELYETSIPPAELADLAVVVETKELGIHAGPQDRVAQAFGGLTYMDFGTDVVSARGHGHYEPLDPGLLPPVLIAYRPGAAVPSSRPHRELRSRIERGDRETLDAIRELAELARSGRDALLREDRDALGTLLDRNFELRRSLHALDPRHERMVELSRSLGMPANYAGSGGAIVALLGDHPAADRARAAFEAEGCATLIPTIG